METKKSVEVKCAMPPTKNQKKTMAKPAYLRVFMVMLRFYLKSSSVCCANYYVEYGRVECLLRGIEQIVRLDSHKFGNNVARLNALPRLLGSSSH